MPIRQTNNALSSPFTGDDTALTLSDLELRETAYEILVRACRSSGVSRVKKALGLKSSASGLRGRVLGGAGETGSIGRSKRAVTVGEMIRVQMGVSEQTYSRIRRALLRVAAGQVCA